MAGKPNWKQTLERHKKTSHNQLCTVFHLIMDRFVPAVSLVCIRKHTWQLALHKRGAFLSTGKAWRSGEAGVTFVVDKCTFCKIRKFDPTDERLCSSKVATNILISQLSMHTLPLKNRLKSSSIRTQKMHMMLLQATILKLLLEISKLKWAKSRPTIKLRRCTAFTQAPVRMVSLQSTSLWLRTQWLALLAFHTKLLTKRHGFPQMDWHLIRLITSYRQKWNIKYNTCSAMEQCQLWIISFLCEFHLLM
jgi:hypothetical protein